MRAKGEHVQRSLIRVILAEFEQADEYGKHLLVLLINKMAASGTFSSVAISGITRFRRAVKKVQQRDRVQRNMRAAREEAERKAAELAAGPPLGVSVKPNAVLGVTIMQGVFAPDANGRWGEVLVDPDYADDTKLRYMDDGTESEYMKQHTLGKAVRSTDDLIVNWPAEPEPVPEPSPEYIDMMHREAAKGKTLHTVLEWLTGAHYDFAQAVKALDELCTKSTHMRDEIAGSVATAHIVQYSARHLADAVQACKIKDDPEQHNIWDASPHNLSDEQKVERAEHAVFKTIWAAMRHRRKLFGHELTDIHSIFDAVDVDKSGKLSYEEFQVAMRRLDLGLSDEQLKDVFDITDQNNEGTIDYAEFAEELHLRHATPRQTYAHRMACILRLLTTQSMGRLVQSAGIAAVDSLAQDATTCHMLVQLEAMGILVDLQDAGDITPYWSDPERGNIASHARIALSSLFVHVRTPVTVKNTMSGLLEMVQANRKLFTDKDKDKSRTFKAAGWVNALVSMDSLGLLKAGNVGRDEAINVLAGVNLRERSRAKKDMRLPNERTGDEEMASINLAGPTAGAIGLTLNIIKKLTGQDIVFEFPVQE